MVMGSCWCLFEARIFLTNKDTRIQAFPAGYFKKLFEHLRTIIASNDTNLSILNLVLRKKP